MLGYVPHCVFMVFGWLHCWLRFGRFEFAVLTNNNPIRNCIVIDVVGNVYFTCC